MVYTVYIDMVFLTNAFMDMAVLLIVGKMLSCPARFWSVLAAAGTGGLWSCLVVLCPGMPLWLQGFGTYVGAGALMAVLAFGIYRPREILRAVACMYLISLFLGGVMLTIRENTRAGFFLQKALDGGRGDDIPFLFWIFIAGGTAAGCYGLTGLLRQYMRKLTQRGDLCRVTLRYRERTETVTGLIDTGNRLSEPVTGRPVHVAEKELMERLCPAVEGIIYVPYRSVGSSGVLPALFVDEIEVEQRGESYCLKRPLVAVSDQLLSPSKDYQILIQKTDEGIYSTDRRTFP